MLSVRELSKTYAEGRKVALRDVSLDIREGEFTALLGQNGAGKSTLINIIAGNVKKDSGRVTVGGYDLDRQELDTKRIIGVVPQEIVFDFVFTVREVLTNQAGYFGLKKQDAYIDELLESLALKEKQNAKVRDLSGGMKRRLLIAKALIHRPKLLFLDEPTAGVDIEMRHSLYEFLNRIHQSGTTIVLTTHYLEEAERLCNRIMVIRDGRLIADQPKAELMRGLNDDVSVEIHFEKDLELKDFNFLGEYRPVLGQPRVLSLRVLKNDMAKVFQKLNEHKMEFSNLVVEKERLEDVYLNLIRQ